tara:strand:- start:1720 stop:2571 length:852 start_codon:yes stop_codon:yes gene_type:complete
MKIYDCFNFFNELDILELRLNILYEYVDYFVIVESSVTHSGQPKPFYLEENMDRFTKFSDKIISYKVNDTPEDFVNLPHTENAALSEVYKYITTQTNRFNRQTQPDYGRDFFQKESVRRALLKCFDDDLIMISDADEIPNPEVLKNINELSLDTTLYALNQNMYCYYLNMLKQTDWYGTRFGLYKNIKKLSFNEIRGDNSLSKSIPNGGWHFSFMGGEEMVKKKITSYSARELANPHVLGSLASNMEANVDPFFRGSLTKVNIDETYPKYVIDNLDKIKHLIK